MADEPDQGAHKHKNHLRSSSQAQQNLKPKECAIAHGIDLQLV